MSRVGPTELTIVLVIVILIFGVGRLGKLGRDLGEGICEFRQSLAGEDDKGKDGAKDLAASETGYA
jgi:sec-independent protein translocase protein TatA